MLKNKTKTNEVLKVDMIFIGLDKNFLLILLTLLILIQLYITSYYVYVFVDAYVDLGYIDW